MLTISPIVKILCAYTLRDSFRIQLSTFFFLLISSVYAYLNLKSFQLVRLDKLLGDHVTAAVLVVITSLQALTLNITFTHGILCLAIGKRHQVGPVRQHQPRVGLTIIIGTHRVSSVV